MPFRNVMAAKPKRAKAKPQPKPATVGQLQTVRKRLDTAGKDQTKLWERIHELSEVYDHLETRASQAEQRIAKLESSMRNVLAVCESLLKTRHSHAKPPENTAPRPEEAR